MISKPANVYGKHRAFLPTGQTRCERLGVHGPHVHLVCQVCGTVVGIERDEAQPLADRLLARHGFAVALDRLAIPGLCQRCSDQTTKAD